MPKTLLRELFQSRNELRAGTGDYRTVKLPARSDIVRQGERPALVSFLLDGWAMRYKQLSDGRTQNLSIMLPNELCDGHASLVGSLDHAIGTVTQVTCLQMRRSEFDALIEERPAVARAVWRQDLLREAIHREWLVGLGQKSAVERIAHLFCETFLRLEAIGRVQSGGRCEFPLRQADMADLTGLTAVHVNRTLQELRRGGLIRLDGRQLTIPSLDPLMRLGHFDPAYLKLGKDGAEEESSPLGQMIETALSNRKL